MTTCLLVFHFEYETIHVSRGVDQRLFFPSLGVADPIGHRLGMRELAGKIKKTAWRMVWFAIQQEEYF